MIRDRSQPGEASVLGDLAGTRNGVARHARVIFRFSCVDAMRALRGSVVQKWHMSREGLPQRGEDNGCGCACGIERSQGSSHRSSRVFPRFVSRHQEPPNLISRAGTQKFSRFRDSSMSGRVCRAHRHGCGYDRLLELNQTKGLAFPSVPDTHHALHSVKDVMLQGWDKLHPEWKMGIPVAYMADSRNDLEEGFDCGGQAAWEACPALSDFGDGQEQYPARDATVPQLTTMASQQMASRSFDSDSGWLGRELVAGKRKVWRLPAQARIPHQHHQKHSGEE